MTVFETHKKTDGIIDPGLEVLKTNPDKTYIMTRTIKQQGRELHNRVRRSRMYDSYVGGGSMRYSSRWVSEA